MSKCSINVPVPSNNRHGKLKIKTVCNDELLEELEFDATKGDLRLHLICEEEDGYAFYVGSDFAEAIENINNKLDSHLADCSN